MPGGPANSRTTPRPFGRTLEYPQPASLDDEAAAAAALLDAAEDILNAAGPTILAEVEAEAQARRGADRSGRGGVFGRLFRRKRP